MSVKRQSLKYISGVLVCVGAFSTAAYAINKPKSLASAVNPNWAVLGAPTFYATGMPTSTTICIDTTNSSIGTAPQAGFTLGSTVSGVELNSVFNLGTKVGLPGLESYGITANANASFSANAKNTEYSYNYNYLYTYSSDAKFTTTYGDANLSTNGKNALAIGQAAFLQTCGDSYVSNLRAGVVLAVNVKVTFQNKEDANKFAAEYNASIGETPLANINGTISTEASKITKNAIVSISALQNGGTPESLNQILGYDPTSKSYYATACGLAQSSGCENIINAIINYAVTLPTQVKQNNEMILNNLYYFEPTISTYASLGISVPQPQPLSAETQSAQNTIINQINLSQARIMFLNNYKQNSLPLQADVKTYLAKQIKTLQARIDYINKVSVDCFNANAASCPAIVASLTTTIKSNPSAFGFDSAKYAILNSAWYYTYNKIPTFIVPVSFHGAYATLAGTSGKYLEKAGLAATVYYNPDKSVAQFDIPDIDLFWGSYNSCFPATNDDKSSDTRNFVCNDGFNDFKKTNVQFIAVTNPI